MASPRNSSSRSARPMKARFGVAFRWDNKKKRFEVSITIYVTFKQSRFKISEHIPSMIIIDEYIRRSIAMVSSLKPLNSVEQRTEACSNPRSEGRGSFWKWFFL